MSGASIVCLASIDWEFNRQNPQEVATAFAESGNSVLFIENTGVRRPSLRDAGRLWTRLKKSFRARGGFRAIGKGIDVFSPLLLPFPYSRPATRLNARVVLRVVRRWRRANADAPLIVITFLPTPLARSVTRALAPALVVYYCIDRLEESSPGARRLRESEPKLLAEADLVVVTSAALFATAAPLASRVELLPSGVHFADFEPARRSNAVRPAAFDGLKGPVIGFVGSLRRSTDLGLLTRAAGLAPDLNFVFVGPLLTDVRRLAACRNVRLVGAVPHTELANYVRRFDAGILPYALDAFTAALRPVKLMEYLAAGLPVVATPLPEILLFADQHPGLVTFAGDEVAFVAALRAVLAANGPAAIDRRIAVARRYDWGVLMSRMSEWMESSLDTKTRRP